MEGELRQSVYIVLDVSGSMFGEPMQSMLNGVEGLLSALRSSPETNIDNTFVSVIAFSTRAKTVVENVRLQDFMLPEIQIGGCTNVANMMSKLLICAKEKREPQGTAMAFFFMDGYPTDASKSIEKAIDVFHAYDWKAYAAFAIAGGAEKHFLARLTSPRRVFDLTCNPDFQSAIAPLSNDKNGMVLNV